MIIRHFINFQFFLSLSLACLLGGSTIQPTFAGCCQSTHSVDDRLELGDETFEQTSKKAGDGDSWAQLRLAIRYMEGNGTAVV